MSRDLSKQPQTVTVEARAHGWRLDYYLSRLYPNYSRSLLQRAIVEDAVLLNGLSVKPARRLRVNDRISIRLPAEPDSSLRPEDIPLEVVFEDEHIAVINKPADMVTHPSKGNFTGTLAAAVQFHFDKLSDVAGQLRPGIVHRLDRDTTGVIVIAKNNQVHHRLTRQFEQREIKKEYRALVYGVMQLDGDVLRTHLKIHPKVREKMMICPADEPNAREAVTRYEVLERFDGFTYVRLLPQTGRTHQLRVHLQHLRHPIVADKLYSSRGELRLDELVERGRATEGRRDVGVQALACAPDSLKAELQQPDSLKAELQQPDSLKAELQQPDGLKAELQQPDSLKAELQQPDSLKAELQQPDSLKAELQQPDSLKAELQQPEEGGKENAFLHPSSFVPDPSSPESERGILISRQALHAFRLTFRHPASERIMEFEVPLPLDMQRTLDALQKYGVR